VSVQVFQGVGGPAKLVAVIALKGSQQAMIYWYKVSGAIVLALCVWEGLLVPR